MVALEHQSQSYPQPSSSRTQSLVPSKAFLESSTREVQWSLSLEPQSPHASKEPPSQVPLSLIINPGIHMISSDASPSSLKSSFVSEKHQEQSPIYSSCRKHSHDDISDIADDSDTVDIDDLDISGEIVIADNFEDNETHNRDIGSHILEFKFLPDLYGGWTFDSPDTAEE